MLKFSHLQPFPYFRIMLSTAQLYEYFQQNPIISTDTRHLPKDCIFFALKGPSFNGNTFALQALQEGAAFAVVDEDAGDDPRLLRVDDVLKTLQDLATFHRHRLDVTILAITGSNGKTTTKELTAAVLKQEFEMHFTQGNLNNHIGVPLTLLQLNDDHDFAVIEMGANHQQEIAALSAIAQPDFGLITNIGKAHLEGFGGPEGVKKGKGELYDFLRSKGGMIFIHLDNPILREMLHGYDSIITYGTSNQVQYQGRIFEQSGAFLEVEMMRPFHLRIKTQLTGDYNLDNVLAAVAVGAHFGVEPHDIKSAIENYHPDNQRSQVLRKGSLTIVQDTYNANPSSMKAALDNFSQHFPGEKIIALGEMLELGTDAAVEHMRIAQHAAEISGSTLLLVGSLFAEPSNAVSCHHFENAKACTEWLKNNLPATGNILIKGSRGAKMEQLMNAFQDS